MVVKPTLFLTLLLLSTLTIPLGLVANQTIFSSRASGSGQVVFENSYLFVSPLQAKADGTEKIRLTVFLLDSRGMGVPGETVTLKLPSEVTSPFSQPVTDDLGKAVFDLTSTRPGSYSASALNRQRELSQKARLIFY